MTRLRRFRPSDITALEERIALSHAGVTAEVASVAQGLSQNGFPEGGQSHFAPKTAQNRDSPRPFCDSPVAHVLAAAFQGPYTTTTQFGVDTESAVAKLTGTGKVPGVGMTSLSGSLSNTIVFPSHRSPTDGTLTVAAPTASGGTLVIRVSGPYANLAPTSPEAIHLTFTVTRATGKFASYAGEHGQVALTLDPTSTVTTGGLPQTHVSHGHFRLVLAGA